MRGKIGKHLGINWKFVKQFGTPKNIGNLKKKLKILKKNWNWENLKLKIDNWIIDLI